MIDVGDGGKIMMQMMVEKYTFYSIWFNPGYEYNVNNGNNFEQQ